MDSLNDLTRKMKTVADQVVARVERTQRAVALEITKDLVLNTPVDTGRARSNWQANMRMPRTNVIEPLDPGSQLGINENANASIAISRANEEIAKHQPHEDIWITNNVKYIGFLNDGSSTQTPKLFVERAIKRGESLSTGIDL